MKRAPFCDKICFQAGMKIKLRGLTARLLSGTAVLPACCSQPLLLEASCLRLV